MDTLTQQQRSERMARIRSANTKPERTCRLLISGLGYKYRLNVKQLPGTPDLVFPSLHCIVFVHGCFWHAHLGCGRTPKSRLDFWRPKIQGNRERDLRNERRLRRLGWRVMTVWECQLSNHERLKRRLVKFLNK